MGPQACANADMRAGKSSACKPVQPAFMAFPVGCVDRLKTLPHRSFEAALPSAGSRPQGSPSGLRPVSHLPLSAAVPGAAVHRRDRFLGPAQDLLLPTFDAAGIVIGDALLGGVMPANRLTDETRRAYCCPDPPAAVHGSRRIAASVGHATRGDAVRHRGSLLREPLPPASQPVPDIDARLSALRCRAAALPQRLPGGKRALRFTHTPCR